MKTIRLVRTTAPAEWREVRSIGIERRRRRREADDVADRADHHDLAASDLVDDEHRGHREHEVRAAHDHCLGQRGIRLRTRHPENVGSVVHQCVDARELVECRDRDSQQHRAPVLPLED